MLFFFFFFLGGGLVGFCAFVCLFFLCSVSEHRPSMQSVSKLCLCEALSIRDDYSRLKRSFKVNRLYFERWVNLTTAKTACELVWCHCSV